MPIDEKILAKMLIAALRAQLRDVRECLALMADGEGDDAEIYRDMSRSAVKRIDASGVLEEKDAKTLDGFASGCKRCKAYGESPIQRQRARRDKRRYEKDRKKCEAREVARRWIKAERMFCAVVKCPNVAHELHHVNYDEPLAVVPLCTKHHLGLHDCN